MFLTSVINFIMYSSCTSRAHAIKAEAKQFSGQRHVVVIQSTKIIPPQCCTIFRLFSKSSQCLIVGGSAAAPDSRCAFPPCYSLIVVWRRCPLRFIRSFAKTGQLVHTLSWINTYTHRKADARAWHGYLKILNSSSAKDMHFFCIITYLHCFKLQRNMTLFTHIHTYFLEVQLCKLTLHLTSVW
jgi:hypothetical protein